MKSVSDDFDWSAKKPVIRKLDDAIGLENYTDLKYQNVISSGSKQAVLDLHIESLIDNLTGLNPADIKAIQLEKFDEFIKDSIRQKLKKVTVIHGIGSGALRNIIIKKLSSDSNVSGIEAASFKKFGMNAALEVTFNYSR